MRIDQKPRAAEDGEVAAALRLLERGVHERNGSRLGRMRRIVS